MEFLDERQEAKYGGGRKILNRCEEMVKMLGGEISSVSMSSSESEEELQEKKVKRKQSMMENEMEKQTSETGDEKT